jgi:hypothetical protein
VTEKATWHGNGMSGVEIRQATREKKLRGLW